MGMMLGKIMVETPKYEVVHSAADYEVRRYGPSVVAEVTYNPKEMNNDRDGGFRILADYIGALGTPKNRSNAAAAAAAENEKIAMTAPVVTTSAPEYEKIAMTAPVVTRSGPEYEKIAMTAPVVTDESKSNSMTMQFVLPSKYSKAEDAPRPTDERVVIKEVGERKYGVVRFSGIATDGVAKEKAAKLKALLEKDGFTITGDFLLARYNPPWTLPPLRTNEIMIPVE